MFRSLSSIVGAALALGWSVALEESTTLRTTRLACPVLRHAQPAPSARSLPSARVSLHRTGAQRPMARSLYGRKCCWRQRLPMGIA